MSAPTIDRTTYIGGGDIASILGIGYGSAWQVWARKVHLLPEPEDTLRWRIGRKAEQMLAELFTEETGLVVAGEQKEVVHPEHDFIRGHVDGLVFDGAVEEPTVDMALGVIDHKTASDLPWREVPAGYQSQAQFYLWITGLERCWFSVMHSRWQYRTYVVERDDADIALITERALEFWELVLTGRPPEVDGSTATARALADAYPGGVPDALEVPPFLVTEWRRAKSLAKVAQDELDRIENELKAVLGDHEAANCDGELVATWKPQSRRGALDEDALRAAGVGLDQYRKPSTTYRVLRPVKEKT